MNARLLHCFAILLLLGLGLLRAAPAQAAGGITCTSASMTSASFGTVNPLSSLTATTATLSYTCNNTDTKNTHSAKVCFSIGEPGGNQTNPRLLKSGSNSVQFQLYQDASYSTVWGSQFFGSPTPLQVNLTLAKNASTSGSATLYAQVLGGQTTAVPSGTPYTDNYQSGDTAITINDVQSSSPPGSCSGAQTGVYFPFLVSATVQKNCTVSANDLSLGAVAAGGTPASGSSTLSVACTYTTPYYIGLAPMNVVSTSGAGTMKGASGNNDVVAYQLYSNAGLTTPWGNTATVTSVGNGVSGSGTGSAQTLTVYAKVTGSTDVQPGTYSDVVQVNVNY